MVRASDITDLEEAHMPYTLISVEKSTNQDIFFYQGTQAHPVCGTTLIDYFHDGV
jgi:hypothetical protein